jgi:uncharacterized protein (DUF1684 family)
MPFTTALPTAPALAPPAALDNIQHGYNDKWSCPLTPFENRVKVAVRAGERLFPGSSHE